MIDNRPSYEELQQRLEAAEDILEALQGQQVDAVIGRNAVALLQLQEVREKLRHSEEWRELAMEASGVGLWEYNPHTKGVYWSSRTKDLLGVDQNVEENYWLAWERIHPDDRKQIEDAISRALNPQGNGIFQVDYRVVHPNGRIVWIESRGRTTFEKTDEGPRSVHIRGGMLDVTERKEAETKLRELNRTLEQRVENRTAEARRRAVQLQKLAYDLSNAEDRERDRIAGILHDELQQHLAALRYRLAMLLMPSDDEDAVEKRIQQMQQMIDACIQQSRDLSHELSPPMLRQNGLTFALKWLVRDIKEKHGLNVSLDIAPETDPESSSLTSVLFRSVRELLFNCRKHAEVDAAHVEVSRNGDGVQVRVQDEGKGVLLSRLRDRRKNKPGFGLMAIEERIRFLGGQIEFESAPGQGFRTTIIVPYVDEPEA